MAPGEPAGDAGERDLERAEGESSLRHAVRIVDAVLAVERNRKANAFDWNDLHERIAAALAQRPQAGAPGGEVLSRRVRIVLEDALPFTTKAGECWCAENDTCVPCRIRLLIAAPAPAPVAPPPSVVDEDDLAENADYLHDGPEDR